MNMDQPTPHALYPHMIPQTHEFVFIEAHLISNLCFARSRSFAIFWLQILWVLPHEMLDGCIIPSLGVIPHVLRDRIIFMSQIWGAPLLKKLAIKANIKVIYVTSVSAVQVQPGECFSPNPTNMPVFQLCAFHIIFLILWFSLAIDNFPRQGFE